MRLLIDIGNTRLKWALWRDGRRAMGGVFAHRETTLEAGLTNNWTALPTPHSIHVASVVGGELESALSALINEHFSETPQFVRSPASALGITNAYREPQRLGVDRFLALAALHAASPRAQVLVSCGTALTLDAIDASGRHLGGLIVPSPTLMRSALGAATARIGDVHGEIVEIANNTADAVTSGSILAAVALIERFRAETAARVGSAVALICDGGGVDEWLHLLPHAERGRDLVLRGLARWAEADLDSR
ncbi:MAG: type III pantothenate kinase [Dokdonella sp.]